MRNVYVIIILLATMLPAMAQEETTAPMVNADSISAQFSLRKKFYYGYNFDIYFHNDTQDRLNLNGWSFTLTPEFGYKVNERTQVGLRLGGSFYSQHETYTIKDVFGEDYDVKLKIRGGSWELAPYGRYCLKTYLNGRVSIWLELHGYVNMMFPTVVDGDPMGTDYQGLKYSITYGAQLSPLLKFKFNEKSTFNFFFSILSLGYSGTARMYKNTTEYSNDLILFSGKLSNLVANQFTPGLYGIKFGVQKSF
ncbi:MAG: hypothetical protein MJZ79_06725 [Paludibacteraceae bacterium]|nr:hypothetical protein [Paludibacteraceae bacterium]